MSDYGWFLGFHILNFLVQFEVINHKVIGFMVILWFERSKRYPKGCFWIEFGFRVVCRSCTDETGHINMKKIIQNDMSFFPVKEKWHVVFLGWELSLTAQNDTSFISGFGCRLFRETTRHFSAKRHVVSRPRKKKNQFF